VLISRCAFTISDLNNNIFFKILSQIIDGHSTKIEFSPNFLYFKSYDFKVYRIFIPILFNLICKSFVNLITFLLSP
jgi:hypothetical protein